MELNIIHLEQRKDRLTHLELELQVQKIDNFKYWPGFFDEKKPCRGISRAHKQIVADAKKRNLKNVLIAEDDVKFSAPGAFAYFLTRQPEYFDLYLGGISYGRINDKGCVSDFAGLMLYIVSHSFYDIFLSVTEERHLDRSLKGLGKYYVCNPFAAIQYNGYSDNVMANVDYSFCFKGRKLFNI